MLYLRDQCQTTKACYEQNTPVCHSLGFSQFIGNFTVHKTVFGFTIWHNI